MFPNWLLPTHKRHDVRSLPKDAVREHIIWVEHAGDRNQRGKAKNRDLKLDEMRRLEKCGWKRAEIARHFGLCNSTVSKALGSKGETLKGRDRKPMEVDGKVYRTQSEVFDAFKVRKPGLRKLIESGRAKYV